MDNDDRPDRLDGCTIKIKPPGHEHAVYITVNDREINGVLVPYEIFFNCKNMQDYMWIQTTMGSISRVFRGLSKEMVIDMIEDLKTICNPVINGSYMKKGREEIMPSIIADIGYALETHLKTIGYIK